MKPVIKWAGGKTQLLEEIKLRMPEKYNRYYEPFFGGGALYFDILPEKATINDYNFKLINIYKVIKNDCSLFTDCLDVHQNNHNHDYFYEIRKRFNENILVDQYDVQDAADFIYLNKMCFNGLYRVNSKGMFNVPSGGKTKCNLYDCTNIHDVSIALKKVSILNGDFEKACNRAKKGDFVFFDSPYYDTFDNYQKDRFGEVDHIRLANLYKRLSKHGVHCLLTNSDTDFIKELYGEFNIDTVDVKRMINCNGKKRTGKEVIITNY